MGELGVRCEVSPGGQLSLAAPEVTMALYRLSCEAVAYLMDQAPTDLITLSTSSSGQGHQWRVEAVIESAGQLMARPSRSRLLSGLGVAGLGEAKMRSRAKLYAGGLQVESLASGGMRVSIQLSDRMEVDIADLEVAA
jgi:signal transduction histidine kinase